MMHYSISPDGLTVLKYKKEAIARAKATEIGGYYANDLIVTVGQLPMSVLVALHNLVRPEKPIKKFADRPTAEKRMEGVLEILAKVGPMPAGFENEAVGFKAPKEPKAPKTPKDPNAAPVPRAGKLAGMTIVLLTKENPRKAGTSGGRSWALITKGMTVEQYLAAGGIRRDLEWDIAHNWAKVVPTPGHVAGQPLPAPAVPVKPEGPETGEIVELPVSHTVVQ